jgi:hypothetical protein
MVHHAKYDASVNILPLGTRGSFGSLTVPPSMLLVGTIPRDEGRGRKSLQAKSTVLLGVFNLVVKHLSDGL